MKIEGLEEFSRNMKSLANKARELEGTSSVPLGELMSPSFISEHTRFCDVTQLFEASGFKCESKEDLDAIPGDDLDRYIRSESSFSSWEEMLGAAVQNWTAKKLGF